MISKTDRHTSSNRIQNCISFTIHEVKLFKISFLVAYFGLLRVGELVYTTEVQENRPLLWTYISLEHRNKAVQI